MRPQPVSFGLWTAVIVMAIWYLGHALGWA